MNEETVSNNPFKMKGSLIGLIVGIILMLSYGSFVEYVEDIPVASEIPWGMIIFLNPVAIYELPGCHEAGCGILTIISSIIYFPLLGLFVGFSIHYFLRKRKQ